jgi:Transposase DDE domain
MKARRMYSAQVDRATGIVYDQAISMQALHAKLDYPDHLRRVRFKDPETGKILIFLTNRTTLLPLTIAALYKSRWQVELFFNWIKQHLRIRKLLGTTENAVKAQPWCATPIYVLIVIIKKELQLNASLYTLLQIVSVSVFEKTELSCALQPHRYTTELPNSANQLNLFDI